MFLIGVHCWKYIKNSICTLSLKSWIFFSLLLFILNPTSSVRGPGPLTNNDDPMDFLPADLKELINEKGEISLQNVPKKYGGKLKQLHEQPDNIKKMIEEMGMRADAPRITEQKRREFSSDIDGFHLDIDGQRKVMSTLRRLQSKGIPIDDEFLNTNVQSLIPWKVDDEDKNIKIKKRAVRKIILLLKRRMEAEEYSFNAIEAMDVRELAEFIQFDFVKETEDNTKEEETNDNMKMHSEL